LADVFVLPLFLLSMMEDSASRQANEYACYRDTVTVDKPVDIVLTLPGCTAWNSRTCAFIDHPEV